MRCVSMEMIIIKNQLKWIGGVGISNGERGLRLVVQGFIVW